MSRDDDHILGPLRRSDAPDLDPTSLDRIESGLRVQHAALHKGGDGSRIPRWLVAVPALVVVLVLVTVALVVRDEAVVAALEVRDAYDVMITLPSGETIEDPQDGFALIDGAIVVVGDEGSITIGDVTLGSGAVVTVRDGQLVTDVVATTTTAGIDQVDGPTTTSGPAVGEERTTTSITTPPDSRPTDSRPPDSESPIEPVDTEHDRDSPADALRDTPAEPAEPAEPADGSSDTGEHRDGARDEGDAVSEPHTGVDVSVALRVTARDGRVRVAWNTDWVDETSWTVRVLRTIDGSAPESPGNAATIGEGPHGEITDLLADLADDVIVLRYRVVVVDDGGGVVARSEIQTLDRAD